MMEDELELLIDYPSAIAQKLVNDEIDVGLVPVAIIPELKEYHIISDYCISCDGPVDSCLFVTQAANTNGNPVNAFQASPRS